MLGIRFQRMNFFFFFGGGGGETQTVYNTPSNDTPDFSLLSPKSVPPSVFLSWAMSAPFFPGGQAPNLLVILNSSPLTLGIQISGKFLWLHCRN